MLKPLGLNKKKGNMKDTKPPSENELTLTRMAVVAASFAFGVEDYEIMKVPRGHERITKARQTVYWLLRKTGMTYPRIGATMGKDHVSAIHGVKNIENILDLGIKDGYSVCIGNAFTHFKEFYAPHREKEKERMIERMENVI